MGHLTKNSNTTRELQELSQSNTVVSLKNNQISAIENSVGNSITEILDRPVIAMLLHEVDLKQVQAFIAIQIGKLVARVNIAPNLNIQTYQVRDIAEQLVELYPVESIEDFILCFKRGGLGFYGTIYRLDASVLQDWMSKYLDEKYNLIEAGYSKQKEEEKQDGSVLDYEKFKERAADFIKPKRHTNANENEYQRFRLAYLEERKKQIENEIGQSPGTQTEAETAE